MVIQVFRSPFLQNVSTNFKSNCLNKYRIINWWFGFNPLSAASSDLIPFTWYMSALLYFTGILPKYSGEIFPNHFVGHYRNINLSLSLWCFMRLAIFTVSPLVIRNFSSHGCGWPGVHAQLCNPPIFYCFWRRSSCIFVEFVLHFQCSHPYIYRVGDVLLELHPHSCKINRQWFNFSGYYIFFWNLVWFKKRYCLTHQWYRLEASYIIS